MGQLLLFQKVTSGAFCMAADGSAGGGILFQ